MVVAGRDVLKVIKLRGADDGLELELNMRVGKMTMTMCSNDVAWHHINPNEIATAATNGHVRREGPYLPEGGGGGRGYIAGVAKPSTCFWAWS